MPLADARDLACTIESAELAPTAGLPKKIRLTLRNKSRETRVVPLPRPQAPGDFIMDAERFGPPYLYLGLKRDGRKGQFVLYTAIRAESRVAAQVAVLKPGEHWTGIYALADFYFWGPCGPDTGGDFTRLFGPGTEEIVLEAALELWKGEAVRSNPLPVKCSYEASVFKPE